MVNKMKKYLLSIYNLFVIILFVSAAGCSSAPEAQKTLTEENQNYTWLNTDTIKAGRFDTGKMWTFEYAPVDYFGEEYNFTPTQEWLDKARMAALKFATWCSASFVSEDGLIMTNNHCARETITDVSKPGENLQENGFYAITLEEERKIPDLFVEQLVRIEDVTSEMQSAVDKADDLDKGRTEKLKMMEIEKREASSSGLRTQVTKLYNGGKYSLYYYKRYNDVRLVFTPESQLGYFGGDPDNFTYPRYNLDCTFYRVYDENGKPLKTEHYFKWSKGGAIEGEPVFVVGNPGRTNRLSTVAQLEYMRDILYPRTLDMIDGLVAIYQDLLKSNPADEEELQNKLMSYQNSQKAYGGMLAGLRDPVLMAKKRDFERSFKSKVQQDPELSNKYGGLWDKIAEVRNEMRSFDKELYAYQRHPLSTPEYFFIAEDIIDLAEELERPAAERNDELANRGIDSVVSEIYPEDINKEMQRQMLKSFVEKIYNNLGSDNPLVQKFTGGRRGEEAVNYVLNNSHLTSKEKTIALVKKGSDAVLNSDDPFIYFLQNSNQRRAELQSRSGKLTQVESAYSQSLGRALFEVYGTSIPPDATFTLRISDGVVQGFPYNGTIAPPVTTFYGLYDRYYSFKKEFPWNLPEKWKTPPAEFDMHTPFNFISTNDIIGGNSGSPIINKDGEIVGLAFDGNIQSLPGNFIFTTEENRTVAVHSEGMVEAIQDMYKATGLSEELRSGKLNIKTAKEE
jgi:hypothetical protein